MHDIDRSLTPHPLVRSPDGSAHVHLLLAGLAIAARTGLQDEGSPELHAADLQRIPRRPA